MVEPAVGLGCILRSAQWEQEEDEDTGGKKSKKQKHYVRASKYTSSMVVSQQDKEPQARMAKKTRKNTVVTFLLFKRPQCPVGYNGIYRNL